MKRYIRHFQIAPIFLILFSILLVAPVQAQHGTETEIIFAVEKKEQAREQLRRLLAQYDLDPWIYTRLVRFELGVDAHSTPVPTLNARHLDNDLHQLSIFMHEQMLWFLNYKYPEGDLAALEELKSMYQNPPGRNPQYYHIIVGWLELDAMAQLVGEETARQVKKEIVRELTDKPFSSIEKIYRWYNRIVLEDTQKIGAFLAKYGILITPGKGLVVSTEREPASTQPRVSNELHLKASCDGIRILSDELTTQEAEAYCRYVADLRKK